MPISWENDFLYPTLSEGKREKEKPELPKIQDTTRDGHEPGIVRDRCQKKKMQPACKRRKSRLLRLIDKKLL